MTQAEDFNRCLGNLAATGFRDDLLIAMEKHCHELVFNDGSRMMVQRDETGQPSTLHTTVFK